MTCGGEGTQDAGPFGAQGKLKPRRYRTENIPGMPAPSEAPLAARGKQGELRAQRYRARKSCGTQEHRPFETQGRQECLCH